MALSEILGAFGINPVILRIAWILPMVFTGFVPGVIAYLLMSLIVPEKPEKQ